MHPTPPTGGNPWEIHLQGTTAIGHNPQQLALWLRKLLLPNPYRQVRFHSGGLRPRKHLREWEEILVACQPINRVGNRTAAIQSNWRWPPQNTVAREPRMILQWHSNSYGFYEKHSWTEIKTLATIALFHYHGLLNRPRRAASETRIEFCC